MRMRVKVLAIALLGTFVSPRPGFPAGFGEVHFENSGAGAAQADFLQGLAQLHDFEYDFAAKSFRRAEEIDPGFAMAYWGEAMTKNHPIWMQQDLEGARSVLARLGPTPDARAAKAPTLREKGYLGAVEILYGTGSKFDRDFKYADAMRELSRRFPDDPDAAAFYALALLGTAHEGRDIPTYMKAAGILEPLFCRYPDHPGIAHYLIHSCDDPVHASLALPAARAYSRIAPEAAHAQHMCSHIFVALGMWDKTVEANEKAVAVVNDDRKKAGLPPKECGHYPSWLQYGYLEQGREREARQALGRCEAEVRAEKAPGPGAASLDPDHSSLGSYVAMWTRQLLDGSEKLPLDLPVGIDASKSGSSELRYQFARALAAARRGDLDGAKAAAERFRAARKSIAAELAKPGESAEKNRAEVLDLEIQGAIREAEGADVDAVAILRRAAGIEDGMPAEFGPPFVDEPSHELLGQILLKRGRPAEASAEFSAALSRAPRRTASLLGLARAEAAAGRTEEARRAFAELAGIWREADRIPPDVAAGADNVGTPR